MTETGLTPKWEGAILPIMNNEQQKPHKRTPPYIPVARLDKMIGILSAKTPSVISPVLFTSNSYSKIDAQLAMSALRFLDLIDGEGSPTQKMAILRIKGEGRADGFKQIVEEAYEPLFENLEEPHKLEKDALFNAFGANYPKLSDRVYRAAIPVFLKLCEYAGLKEQGTPTRGVSKSPRTSTGERKQTSKTQKLFEVAPDSWAQIPVAEGRMIIALPAFLKDKILDDEDTNVDWVEVRKAIKKFADTHIKKNEASP